MPSQGDLVGPFPDGVDHEDYDRMRRRVLWALPSGLYLLGTVGAERTRRNLMTLNWLTQVSVAPKHIAISVDRLAFSHVLLADSGRFAISLLGRDDRALVRKFVKPAAHDPEARTLNGVSYVTAATGAPIAASAVAWLDCEVRHCVDAGSHTVFVGEVVDAGEGTGGSEAAGGGELAGGASLEAILRMEDTRMSYGG